MGCCLSTSKAATSKKNERRISTMGSESYDGSSRACVPSLIEEETVKEVLSETPKLIKPKIEDNSLVIANKLDLQKIEQNLTKIDQKKLKEMDKSKISMVAEEISEISEICSVSGSIVSSTTVTDSRDDGEVNKQSTDKSQAKFATKRSYSGDGKRERMVGSSPVRRLDPSPVRRNDNGGGNLRSGLPAARRRLGTNKHRRDAGESSGRRSRSPEVRSDVGSGASRYLMGRSPSARKTGEANGQNREIPSVKGAVENKWAASSESIDNPLVSLECFIFL